MGSAGTSLMSITEEIDQTDIEILKMLQDDCRITLDEMANKLKISKSTVYYRIKKLERLGIILGCHAKLSLRRWVRTTSR